jgi:hypothetical protein
MLEEFVPHPPLVIKCFINGSYYFKSSYGFRVSVLKTFLDMYRSSSREKKNIIIGNIQTRLDAIERYDKPPFDEEIPF